MLGPPAPLLGQSVLHSLPCDQRMPACGALERKMHACMCALLKHTALLPVQRMCL